MKKFVSILLAVMLSAFLFTACAAPAESSAAPAESSAAPAESSAAPAESSAAPAESSAAPEESPSESAAAEGEAVAAIKAKGKITMLTNAAFPPFEYLGDDNEPAGVDVDIAKKMADNLGVELEVVNMDFEGLVAALVAGKGDFIAAGFTITDERKESVDFTNKYITSAQHIIVRKGDTEIKDQASLEGKVIGVQKGTTGDLYASDEFDESIKINAKSVERYKNAIDAGTALANGKIDCVIVDELTAKAIVAQNDALEYVEEILTEEDYAIAVQKGSDLAAYINAQLDAMTADGTIDQLVLNHTTAY